MCVMDGPVPVSRCAPRCRLRGMIELALRHMPGPPVMCKVMPELEPTVPDKLWCEPVRATWCGVSPNRTRTQGFQSCPRGRIHREAGFRTSDRLKHGACFKRTTAMAGGEIQFVLHSCRLKLLETDGCSLYPNCFAFLLTFSKDTCHHICWCIIIVPRCRTNTLPSYDTASMITVLGNGMICYFFLFVMCSFYFFY